MRTSEAINELATAMAAAQAIMKGAAKDAENPHFRSRYADLASVWDACRAALTANGLSVVQAPRGVPAEGGWIVEVETILLHKSGQWMADTLTVPVGKPDAQGLGSAITYARRYSLAAFVGVAPEDDDGNAAASSGGVKVVVPDGFRDWLDDFLATADEGLPALEAAWKASAPAFRDHATKYHRDALAAAKKTAKAVTGA